MYMALFTTNSNNYNNQDFPSTMYQLFRLVRVTLHCTKRSQSLQTNEPLSIFALNATLSHDRLFIATKTDIVIRLH